MPPSEGLTSIRCARFSIKRAVVSVLLTRVYHRVGSATRLFQVPR